MDSIRLNQDQVNQMTATLLEALRQAMSALNASPVSALQIAETFLGTLLLAAVKPEHQLVVLKEIHENIKDNVNKSAVGKFDA